MPPRLRLALVLLLCGLVRPAAATTPSPVPTGAPAPGPSSFAPVASPASDPTATRAPSTPRAAGPSPSPTRAVTAARELLRGSAADGGGEPVRPGASLLPAALATAVPAAPRAYRTPERGAPAPFVAPEGSAPASAGDPPPGRAPIVPAPVARPAAQGSALVVFRVTARTALEGFDLRVGYPRAVGAFGTGARPAECQAGTGLLVAANDRGDGELRLLVASAQALPFPLDVFCRFTAEPGAGLGAGDLTVRVAEVTSDGRRGDPALLLVSVAVR